MDVSPIVLEMISRKKKHIQGIQSKTCESNYLAEVKRTLKCNKIVHQVNEIIIKECSYLCDNLFSQMVSMQNVRDTYPSTVCHKNRPYRSL